MSEPGPPVEQSSPKGRSRGRRAYLREGGYPRSLFSAGGTPAVATSGGGTPGASEALHRVPPHLSGAKLFGYWRALPHPKFIESEGVSEAPWGEGPVREGLHLTKDRNGGPLYPLIIGRPMISDFGSRRYLLCSVFFSST